jgi:hypothetical protein
MPRAKKIADSATQDSGTEAKTETKQADEGVKTTPEANQADAGAEVKTETKQADEGAKTTPEANQADDGAEVKTETKQADAGAKTTPEANQADAGRKDEPVLTGLQLRVKNNGENGICLVTRLSIPKKSTTIITYATVSALKMAKANFAQVNGLCGFDRYEVEG